MRLFDYRAAYHKLMIPEVVSYLSQIHEQKGQQNLFIESNKDELSELLEIAKIQSTEASNRIEGVITTDDRLKSLVRNKTTPRNRSEREIAGYRDVLTTVHEDYDFIPIRPNPFLQLHRDLYKSIVLDSNSGDTLYLVSNGFIHQPQQIISVRFDDQINLRYTPQAWLMDLYQNDPSIRGILEKKD